ncbi:MOSC domain-containing protein [Tropicimonas isoalkanivorans]|uniref:MOSC domain-containing protein n=1 Tax=Tropicimonas isoalkanivorans TaxID=441112 RepID=A0A1I1NGK4_9RHOB|nr:MOSC domain-containing protein [Tropicimonas isoalkanivorans]SFC96625.1 MOSC domain-containing protein [Tropicimonas isoalkanivorans]
MPALKPTGRAGTIVWLGHVPNRASALRSIALETAELTFSGLAGEDHGGLTRPSCSRVVAQYPRGTEIRNTRQITLVSEEDLAAIASGIGVRTFDPAWLGANVVVSGLPDFSHIPPSSRLQAPSGATVTVDMQNRPCSLPVEEIEADAPGHGAAFRAAAKGRRGVTAWVEREGRFRIGDSLSLHIPDQRPWSPLPDVRAG